MSHRQGPAVRLTCMTTALRFAWADFGSASLLDLIETHVRYSAGTTPAESDHTFDLAALREPTVTLWTAWSGRTLIGMGALKRIDAARAEVKSMHVVEAYRGQGHAAAILRHLIAEARAGGYRALYLETGSGPAYAGARRLYEGHAFRLCPPFADYREDPHSVFMTLDLQAASDA